SLAFIDYMMPGMNGFELIQIMRELKNIAETPIILLSSLGIIFKDAELKKLGITMCLSKPVRQSRLYESLIIAFNLAKEIPDQNKNKQFSQFDFSEAGNKKNAHILLAEDNPINQQVAL